MRTADARNGGLDGCRIGTDLAVRSALKFLQLVVAALVVASASPALAVTDVMWWHAMSGELGRQLEKLASDFNASQPDYRIVPSYKGNYTCLLYTSPSPRD